MFFSNSFFLFLFSSTTDTPRASQAPWPKTSHRGGGAIIPCVYEMQVPTDKTQLVKNHLDAVVKLRPDLIQVEVNSQKIINTVTCIHIQLSTFMFFSVADVLRWDCGSQQQQH